MHLVTLTVPSIMSNFTMSHAAPDHELQKMFHCQIQALSLEFFSRKSHRTAGTGDTLLMNWQQPCKSPTTHAGVQAISICGWSKICNDVYGSGDVNVVVPTNEKLKVISLTILIFNAKINTTHVALNISSKAGS